MTQSIESIQKILLSKEEQIKKLVDKANQLQQNLSNTNQEILRLDGAIKQLHELLKEVK